jgi:hypothetical protein
MGDDDGELIIVVHRSGEKAWLRCSTPLSKMRDAVPRRHEHIFTNKWSGRRSVWPNAVRKSKRSNRIRAPNLKACGYDRSCE